MTQIKRESDQTRPLFDGAVKGLQEVIDQGVVTDPEYTAVLIRVFNGHIKMRNVEAREASLKYAVAKDLHETVDALKTALRQQLPEYVSEK